MEDIDQYPLLPSATDTLNRQLKSGVSEPGLAEPVIALRRDARLCRAAEDVESPSRSPGLRSTASVRRSHRRHGRDRMCEGHREAVTRSVIYKVATMKFDIIAVRKCLKSFDFATLFREHLGWDKHQTRLDVPIDDRPLDFPRSHRNEALSPTSVPAAPRVHFGKYGTVRRKTPMPHSEKSPTAPRA